MEMLYDLLARPPLLPNIATWCLLGSGFGLVSGFLIDSNHKKQRLNLSIFFFAFCSIFVIVLNAMFASEYPFLSSKGLAATAGASLGIMTACLIPATIIFNFLIRLSQVLKPGKKNDK